MNIPVLCLAQLNRQADASGESRPRLSHLRESGAIEQDADTVLLLHRGQRRDADDRRGDRIATLSVAKQRNGPTGEIELVWDRDFTAFRSKVRGEPWLGGWGSGVGRIGVGRSTPRPRPMGDDPGVAQRK